MKRSIARLGLLAALLAIVALATGALQGMAALAAQSAEQAVEHALGTAPARSAAMRVETARGDDQVADPFDFGDLPVEVFRTLEADAVDGLIVASNPTLEGHARLTAGAWGGASLQSSAARALGVEVGDTLTVGGLPLEVTALWMPLDATDPYWFADPATASGARGTDHGPLIVDESVLAQLPGTPTVLWTIVPHDVTLAHVAALQRAVAEIADEAAVAKQSYLTISGELPQTLQSLRTTVDAAQRLEAVPFALLAATAAITLGRVVQLLYSVRRSESALLRSRGATRTRLTVEAVLEALVVVGVGAGVSAWVHPVVSVVCGGVALLVWSVVAWLGITAATPAAERTTNRATEPVTIGAAVLALIIAGVAGSQFFLYPTGVNPFGALAPALALVAVALVALLAIAPLFSLVERLSARGRGLTRVYAARHVARDATVHATSALLIVLTLGGATLAATYAGSALEGERAAFATANGADLRVRFDVPRVVDTAYLSPRLWQSIDAIDELEAVVAAEARVGGERFDFVARTTAQAGTTTGALSLVLAGDYPGHVDLAVWLADELGQPVRVDGGRVELPVHRTVAVDLPPGAWTVLALESTIGGIGDAPAARLSINGADPGVYTVANPTVRTMIEPAVRALPVTLTDAAATVLSATVGDRITVELPSTRARIDTVVAAIAPSVPGATRADAITADLRELTAYLLADGDRVPMPNELWITTESATAAAEAVALVSPYSASASTRESRLALAAPTSAVFWIGVVASSLLALVAAAAVASALGRLRNRERAVLTALGVTPRQRVAMRFLEFGAVSTTATVLGIAAGALASAVFAPRLAGAPLAVDIVPWICLVGGLLAACLGIGAVSARRSQ